jgi:GNAT superfamily N-acetyltransferase
MHVVDLDEKNEALYFLCLEDWSEELREAGDHKRHWYGRMKEKGLRVKLALDDEGRVGGMIQYLPIEQAFAEGSDLYYILCIWVHGYKMGRGNFQKRGMGKTLLASAEEDVSERGAKGMVAWGVRLPFFMRASWFKKQGYLPVDRMGLMALLWKPFSSAAQPPRLIRPKKKPEAVAGQVTATVFYNGWCPAQNMVLERTRRAVKELGDKVVLHEFNTFDRSLFLEWGIADALFIDDKQVRTGPPPSYDKIYRLIAKKLRRLVSKDRAAQ